MRKTTSIGLHDAGHIGYDEEDREIPLPEIGDSFAVSSGGKQSSWNPTSATYDGRRVKMSLANIRAAIEQAHGL